MKNGTKGVPTVEFVGLKSKPYSLKNDGGVGDRKSKEINKNTVKKKMKHEEYNNVFFSETCVQHEMKKIQSKKQKS